jgi:biotin transport system substrate-specific component
MIMATAFFSTPAFAPSLLPESRAARLVGLVLLAIAGSLLMWVSAKIKVPFYPVPMTLQTLALFGIAAAYGMRLGVATIALYLIEGALGLPVFAGTPEKGIGLLYMAGPTGGYLASYMIAAAVVGYAVDRGLGRNPFKLFGAMLVAEVVILGMGFAWMAYLFGMEKAFAFGVGPFIVTDLVKIALAACLVPAVTALFARAK